MRLTELIAEAADLAISRGNDLPDNLPVELTADLLARAVQHTAESLDLDGITAEELLIHAIADVWSGDVR